MNLVLETTNPQSAYNETRDWHKLGHTVRVTSLKKNWKGGYQMVYRVWVGKKRRSTG